MEEDTLNMHYSVALSDLLEALNKLLDEQFEKDKKSVK